MIPGGIGNAVGMLFFVLALACWSAAMRYSLIGLIQTLTLPRHRRTSDSGTVALLAATGFALCCIGLVAVA